MKLHPLRIITIAIITLLLGSGIDFVADLETTLGLDSLFRIRGNRATPDAVVIVAMDEASENRLGVGRDLTRWRGFHAKLIHELQTQGAVLIAFDLQFIAAHPDQDSELAAAIQSAGNVLLSECVQKLRQGVEDFFGRDECSQTNQQPFVQKEAGQAQDLSEQLVAMRKVPPLALLANAALDAAPFSLSNHAEDETIHEVLTFLDPLAETPTLPVVAWLHYLHRIQALSDVNLPAPISAWLTGQRRHCPENGLANLPIPNDLSNRLYAVICQGDSRYLDFYGPPQTLNMVSYSDVYDGNITGLAGKAVFVGKANRQFSPGKIDYFQSPFKDIHSGKMAGVEILATQFANLLEGRFITSPLPPSLMLAGFGLMLGLLMTGFSGVWGLLLSLIATLAYLGLAVWLFGRNGIWLPVAVPVLIQLPLAWMLALVGSRRDLLHERQRILAFASRVFPQWMPLLSSSPGEWYPEPDNGEMATERDICGICLATDIEGYTSLSAQHTPHEMWELLNAYYQVLGQPVIANQGIITDVVGDAMMSVWYDLPIAEQRLAGCLTALEMQQAVDTFNQASTLGSLATRIGIHEGDMTLGGLDTGKGCHYSVIGDTVNTASRIQGVNKYLGTRILATACVTSGLTELLYRPVGVFRVVGRDEPLELMEILGKPSPANQTQSALFPEFANALDLFQQSQWQAAACGFQNILNAYGQDGPTRFYLNLAETYQQNPPQQWDGVVTLEGK
jgi:adenylate cyclase